MSIFESILYGLISGFAEFLPVSPQGHQSILLRLFGMSSREPLRDLFVHLAALCALLTACKPLFNHLRREQAIASRRTRRKKQVDRKGIYDLRIVKTAVFPLIVGLFFYITTKKFEQSLLHLILGFVINGILLIIPEYIRHGNKNARLMTGLDGILLGISGALSAFPGLSRISAMNAYTMTRGSDRQQALNWILALCVPALVFFIGYDIFMLFSAGAGMFSFAIFLKYLLTAVFAYIGGYFGIVITRYLTVQIGFAGFAYYSWGVAFFTFVLYLIA